MGRWPLLALPWLLASATIAAEEANLPVEFAAPPERAELEPRNADEEQASIVVLSHDIDYRTRIGGWSRNGDSVTERHIVRYLVKDQNGVEALAQHTFFGDETNVVVADIQGRTISPDGSIHPIDPDKDIQKLDIEGRGNREDAMRTVSFPRIEPGAVLDLAWSSKIKGQPQLETVALESAFPTRKMTFTSQGRIVGPGKSFLTGTGQYYWVPFFFTRVPGDIYARLSSQLDLELTAENLPVYVKEPMAPPQTRTAALMGIVPFSFPISRWREHVHIFDEKVKLTNQERNELVWSEGQVGQQLGLAQIDDLGLQLDTFEGRNQAGLATFQYSLSFLTREYRIFSKNSKLGETAAQVEQIAPRDLSFDERVDRLFSHARQRLTYDPSRRSDRKLDKALKRGRASGSTIRSYTKYLLDQAGIDNDLVLILSRYGPPFLPIFETWRAFPRNTYIEARGANGERRYLEPNDPLADAYSFTGAYLGGIVFRDSNSAKKDWAIERLGTSLPVKHQFEIAFSAELPAPDESTQLQLLNRSEGAAANSMRWGVGYPGDSQDASAFTQRQTNFIRGWIRRWSGVDVAEDHKFDLPDPRENVEQPFELNLEIPWSPDIQTLGDQAIVPALPQINMLINDFVTEHRRHPIWLSGGHYRFSMRWTLPPGATPTDLVAKSGTGPQGLSYKLSHNWDGSNSTLDTVLDLTQPYMLKADQYPAVRTFFEQLQRDTETPLLLNVGEAT